jgi:hypothetical protein
MATNVRIQYLDGAGDSTDSSVSAFVLTMSNSDKVPCPCSYCQGKLVSRYLRRQHTQKYGTSESRSSGPPLEHDSQLQPPSPLSEMTIRDVREGSDELSSEGSTDSPCSSDCDTINMDHHLQYVSKTESLCLSLSLSLSKAHHRLLQVDLLLL